MSNYAKFRGSVKFRDTFQSRSQLFVMTCTILKDSMIGIKGQLFFKFKNLSRNIVEAHCHSSLSTPAPETSENAICPLLDSDSLTS